MKKWFKIVGIVIMLMVVFVIARFTVIDDGKYSHVKFITDTKIVLGITNWQLRHSELTKDNINILENYKNNYSFNPISHSSNDNKTIKQTEKLIQLNYDYKNKKISSEQFLEQVNSIIGDIPNAIITEIATWDKIYSAN